MFFLNILGDRKKRKENILYVSLTTAMLPFMDQLKL